MPSQDALELIGGTPLLRVKRLDTGPCELYLKLESQNPGGSIRDRIGRSMIDAAEREGLLGGHRRHLVEATAGNTGLGRSWLRRSKERSGRCSANCLGRPRDQAKVDDDHQHAPRPLLGHSSRSHRQAHEPFCG